MSLQESMEIHMEQVTVLSPIQHMILYCIMICSWLLHGMAFLQLVVSHVVCIAWPASCTIIISHP